MSDPVLELIRGANPYPRELPPLPIEGVMRRLSMGEPSPPSPPPSRRGLPIPGLGGAVVAFSVVLALAIAVVAIATLGHSRPATAPGRASLKVLLAQYAVLRRPQTAADRALAGRAPVIGSTGGFSAGSGPPGGGHMTSYYRVRISGLSHYVAIPRMTRVVVADGVRVALFVERYVRVTTPPKVKITGNDRRQAERQLRGYLRIAQRLQARQIAQASDILVVKAPGQRAQALSPITGYSGRVLRNDPGTIGSAQVHNASFTAPGGKIVALEPDGVTVVRWAWPREWDAAQLRYLPAVSVAARVSDNVAIAAAPPRFRGAYAIGPARVALTRTGGARSSVYFDQNGAAATWLTTSPGTLSKPAPETALSRAAERNPATPNRVFLVPSSVPLRTTPSGSGFQIEFRALLNHATYYATITDEAHAACVRPSFVRGVVTYGAPLVFGGQRSAARGSIFAGSLSVMLRCRGAYRVRVAVIGPHGHPYAPFGSATLTVR